MRPLRERIARKIAELELKEHHTNWDTIIDTAQIRYLFLADEVIDMCKLEEMKQCQ